MNYNKVTEDMIANLQNIVGSRNVIADQEKLETYAGDEVPEVEWKHLPEVVVKPENVRQVSEVLKLANRELIPVTPRGAGTGLAGGAVPMIGGIVLSLEKMNRILEIDHGNLFMVVEPGVTTGDVQRRAQEEGYLYAGDPCSADSSFIGGNVATNAGGNKAIKYGTTTKHIYGLDVVLATGEIITLGGKCVKDVTGYDLVHLMVGSEGTLGVVTKIYLKLLPKPRYNSVLLVPFADMQTAINVVPKIMTNLGVIPTSIEFMDNLCIKSAESFLERKLPYNDAGAYIIIEVEAYSDAQLESDCENIGGICYENGGLEVFMGNDKASQDKIWKPRRILAEALRVTSPVYCMEDIVVPISNIPRLLAAIEQISKKYAIKVPCFGHAGDGNVHATILKEDLDDATWHEVKEKVLEEMYSVTYAYEGKLSGEHGIGAKRKKAMAKFMNPVELKIIASIKKVLDPNLILNPDKLVELF
ncbi:FAD-binding oxidoreductase [Desulfoscipio sp. XC116]|uniref:FAD-binding oxidoreductase n=1 Tax=Desulfoscipio sp. XC116 TaxID=3144975 RepID=UPI00325AF83D